MDLARLELAQQHGRVCSKQLLGFPANVAPGVTAHVYVWILGTSELSLGDGGWGRRMLNGDKQERDKGPS